MKTPVIESKFKKTNRLVISSFLVLAILSLLSVNGIANASENQEFITLVLPSAEQIEHISPDVHLVKLLLRFAENIITLNF